MIVNERFEWALKAAKENHINNNMGIGTFNESTLHATLKYYYGANPFETEQKVNNYHIDAINANGLVEIQTGNFSSIKKKLETLLLKNKVTLVYPIAEIKYIVWVNPETGESSKPRKSPKKGCIQDIFRELYYIHHLCSNKNFTIDIVMLEMLQYKLLDGWNKSRKKGSTKIDKVPTELNNIITLNDIADCYKLIPDRLPEEFTTYDIKKLSGISSRNVQSGTTILRNMGIIEKIGKQGRRYLYKMSKEV